MAYTNHTLFPQALEKWPFEIMKKFLPRHMEIKQIIDDEFIKEVIANSSTLDLKELENKIKEMRIL